MATQSRMQALIEQAEKEAAKQKTVAKTVTTEKAVVEDKKFADIKSNTFFAIVFDPKRTPEEKKDAIAQARTYNKEESKEKNLERLKEYQLFKDFLQTERKKMAQEIIALTDTGTFSQLKDVIDKLSSAILKFDDDLKPLTDTLNAIYDLRMAGKDENGQDITLGVFKEAKDEMKAEAERQAALAEKLQRKDELQRSVEENQRAILDLKEEKILGLSFLGIKKSAKQEIAQREMTLAQVLNEASTVAAEVQDLSVPKEADTKYASFKTQKAKLMELLNISSDGHVERNKALVESAQNFVNNTTTEVNSVRGHLGEMETQTKRLGDGNVRLQAIYAVLTDAEKDAAKANRAQSEELKVAAPDEGTLAKMKREDKLNTINNFIKSTDFEVIDTLETYQGLAQEGVRVQAMGDMCQQQIADVNKLATSGVAGVASSLATVVTGVAQTALNESSEMAKKSIAAMQQRTIELTAQGSIQAAMGIGALADDFNKAVAGMDEMYKGLTAATKIRESGLANLKESKGKIEESIKALQEAVKSATAVHTEVDIQGATTGAAKPANDDGAQKPAAAPAVLDTFSM